MRNIYLNHINKKFYPFLVVISLFFLGFTVSCAPTGKIPPKAVKGVLDLREWNFDPASGSGTDGIINLDGEWEFFWQEFPVGDGLELPEEKRGFITVPSVWNGHIVKRTTESGEVIEEKLGGEGYATYRLKVLLGEEQSLALRLHAQRTAYTLVANNIVVHKSGTIGKGREDSIPDRNVEYINLDNRDKELNLLVPISNFHNNLGGLWYPILLGNNKKIQNLHSNNLSIELFVTGILFIMGVYHLSLFYLRREDKSPLYFGLFCLLVSLRTLLTGENYFHTILPSLGYSLELSLNALTVCLSIPISLEFLNSIYPQEINSIFRRIIVLPSLFISSFVIALPTIYFTKTLPVVHIIELFAVFYVFYVLIMAVRKKREGAKTFLSGFLFFGMIIVNDILYANGIINTGEYAPIGLVIFIFSQSFLLTSRFANAFRQVKDLTQNLEQKVEERTLTLEEATVTLAFANQEIADSRKDTEELNDLIKNINSVSSLTDVMMFLMYYLETNYAYNSFWLVLYDKNKNNLQTTVCVSSTLSETAINYLKSLSLNPEDSLSICTCYTEQKMIYREKEDPLVSKQDNDILDQTQFGYLFHLPFVVYGECIGILTLHKADGKSISHSEVNRLDRFTELISGAIYNSILYRDSQLAKEQAEESFQKARNLNDMMQVVIQSKSIDDIFERIFDLFSERYGLTSYSVYTLDKNDGYLKLYKLFGNANTSNDYLNILYKNHFSIQDKTSIQSLCVSNNKSFWAKGVRLPHPNPQEEENLIKGGIQAFYIIPLVIDNESFGTITFADNKFQRSNIKGLTKSDRVEIENFVRLISPSIYQSLQKTIIEKAYHELQETQAQLVEAERMSSLGQLVGSIAHEINNPISVIRSQSEQLARNIQATLKEIPQFLESLNTSEKELFYEMVKTSTRATESLTTKEERAKRKEIFREIETLVGGTDEIHTNLTEEILLLKLPSPYNQYVNELGVPLFQKFLSHAMIFKNQTNAISNIEIAVEKSSRVVFALRSYLNTELALAKKEANLVEEVEKALHVYDNYVMGKINVRKDFPSELKYTCIPENLSQVWKNLFFNAIQAMYTTDKKLAIRIEKKEKLSDELKSYKTSSIVEESVFQANDVLEWIVVSITDSGTGIADDLQQKVFTPFFTTKSLGEGIGLGLYVCKKIVHEHGGAMFFRSGEGSTEFVVVLPM